MKLKDILYIMKYLLINIFFEDFSYNLFINLRLLEKEYRFFINFLNLKTYYMDNILKSE